MVDIYGGYPNSTVLLENISLLWNLKKIARAQGLSYSSLSFFRQASKHPFFKYLRHFCVHFFQPFFSFFLMNNFCIAPCLFSATKLWEIATRTWNIYLVDGKPIKHVFLFTPSVGLEQFWVDLDGRHVFAPTQSVVVHIWVVCTWSWFEEHDKPLIRVNKAWQNSMHE